MPEDARSLALDVLVEVEREGAFADAELGQRLALSDLKRVDRALATNLVYGTLAWRLRIDTILRRLIRRKIGDLDTISREILRLGLYQLALLDRVPAYAVVNSAVGLAKRHRPAAAGFVNAVLRRAAREGTDVTLDKNDLASLAVRYSHPAWLVDLWRHELGETKTRALMEADNRANPYVVRALIEREQAMTNAKPGPLAPDALILDGPPPPQAPVMTQSEASQLVVLFLGASKGWRVLDACAAPGGKAAYLGRIVGKSGAVLALDPAPGSLERISTTAAAGKVSNVEPRQISVQQLQADEIFDAVLVDAPCSGLGTLRQHPEIRWRRSPSDLDRLAEKQRAILAAAAAHVRPGGYLVYSTCTLTRIENDEVVDGFLASHPEFREVVDTADLDPAAVAVLDSQGRLRTYPDTHDTDGFFAARLRRTGP